MGAEAVIREAAQEQTYVDLLRVGADGAAEARVSEARLQTQ